MDDLDDVEIPLVRQLVVQPADDVQFGRALAVGLGGPLDDLLVASSRSPSALFRSARKAQNVQR